MTTLSPLARQFQDAIDRYSLRSRIVAAVDRYTKDEKWITIGGEKEGDKNHVGGTPVKIDGQGNIKAGPAALAEKGIKNLDDFGGKGKTATAQKGNGNRDKPDSKIPKTADEAQVGTVEHNGQERPLYEVDGIEWTHDLPEGSLGEDYEVMIADVTKLDQAWDELDPSYRVHRGGGGAEIKGRRDGFRKWLEKNQNKPIEMSRVNVMAPHSEFNDSDKPVFGFADGRHRFSVMRDDLRKTAVPVVVDKNGLETAKKLFGYQGEYDAAASDDNTDDSGFSLKRESNKTRKKAEFDDSGNGKQGGLFDTGKNDIKGQNLMFDDHYNPQEAMEDAKKRKENKGKSVLDLPEKPKRGTIVERIDPKTNEMKTVQLNMGDKVDAYISKGNLVRGRIVGIRKNGEEIVVEHPRNGNWNDTYRQSWSKGQLYPEGDLRDAEKTPKKKTVPASKVIDNINKKNEPEGGWSDEDRVPDVYSRSLTADFNRAFYARLSEPARYACQWITLSAKSSSGDKSGGAKVCIGDGGKIEKGPKALKRKKIGSLIGPQNQVDDAIRTGAKRFGVKKADLKEAAAEVWAERRELAKEREELKTMARQWVGITPGEVEKLKNKYLDYDSIPGFDDAASELVNSHPELGIHPDNASEGVWELIQEPRENLPKKHDEDIIEEAAERLLAAKENAKRFGPVEVPDDDDYVPFSRMRQAFDRAFYAKLAELNIDRYANKKPAKGQKSLWDEDDHPRDESGQFAKKESASNENPIKTESKATVDDNGPAGMTRQQALEKAMEGSTRKVASYDQSVRATYLYTGTTSADWTATPVKGMVEDGGKSLPEYDLPKGYEPAPTIFESDSQNHVCELCGHDIKTVYTIQNDKKKWTMGVGSECVTKFSEDGKSGQKLAKEAQYQARRDFLGEAQSAVQKLREWHERENSNYGGRNIKSVVQAIKDKDTRIAAWALVKSLGYDSFGTQTTKWLHLTDDEAKKSGWRGAQKASDQKIANWFKKNAESAREQIDKILQLTDGDQTEHAKNYSRLRQAFDREFYRRGLRVSGHRNSLVDRFNRALSERMVDRYGERWITIGGNQEGDKKHAGGTPVKIDDDGNIKAGPAGLAAKGIKNLKDFGKSSQSDNNSYGQSANNSNNGEQSKADGAEQKQGKQEQKGGKMENEAKKYEPVRMSLYSVNEKPPWVSKITGSDERYGFKRDFLVGEKSQKTNMKRTKTTNYLNVDISEPGIYQTSDFTKDEIMVALPINGKIDYVSFETGPKWKKKIGECLDAGLTVEDIFEITESNEDGILDVDMKSEIKP